MQTFFIAPTDFGVGLTSISLGLVRTLERAGLKVGFFKPIAQPHPGDTGPERSTELVSRTHGLKPPKPLSLAHVERMLGEGQLDELLEEIITLYQQACVDKDVLVVEGMVPTRHASYAARVNQHLAKSLDAEVILVSAPENDVLAELSGRVELQAQLFGGPRDPKVLGVILNKVRGDENMADFAARLREHSPLLRGGDFRLLGCIPFQAGLNDPRTRDVAELLGAQVLNAGDYETRRMNKIILCARTVANTVPLLKPGTLVVTPGDRDDIILAVSLAAINGVPLAGLLLTSDSKPDPRILELCQGALLAGLPILSVSTGSYDTANQLNGLNKEIPVDDRERAEIITDFVASHLDADCLNQRCGTPREMRLSPAVFRYQLIQRAQQANKRIVLPEGAEPMTVQAAAICQARGIARCVLLAKPDDVQAVARAQGITLPEGLEILDPDLIRDRYVEPMVSLRKSKSLNAPMAEQQLEDPVVIGTMMLALDEVDGLVSGLVHSTANTIRPALQLIKTAPGCSLVSSVFFMLFPEQVLVYGDCVMNPHPSAAELAEIALQSADSAEAFGIAPRVAMISYSSGDSASGEEVEKVREATLLAQETQRALQIDGPLQYDTAANLDIARQLAPNSPVAGRATVFVFPDLNTGNTTHKAVQRSADCVSLGPMLQGLRKPVNDLPRGAQVDDIVYTIALTAIQAHRAMDYGPMAILRGALAALLLGLNTIVCCTPLFIVSLFKLCLPFAAAQRVTDELMRHIHEAWISNNNAWIDLLARTRWQVDGLAGLDYQHSYLITSNHQSWVDILVLQYVLNRRIRPLKFFLKQALIWVPVIGLAWWALGFPFMKRYSKAYLDKHPEKRGKDLETTRKTCAKFRGKPTAIFNFAEGTRFTDAKHRQQQSPFRHLLKPKAGGIAFVLDAMGEQLESIINVTIHYPDGAPGFWDLLCGRVRRIVVQFEELAIPEAFLGRSYDQDEEYRLAFQQWINRLWEVKDEQLEKLKSS